MMSNDGDKHAGLRLHLSSSCCTGYKCVYEHFGRFQAKRWVDGKEVCLEPSPRRWRRRLPTRGLSAAFSLPLQRW